jgi:hypothetical protein
MFVSQRIDPYLSKQGFKLSSAPPSSGPAGRIRIIRLYIQGGDDEGVSHSFEAVQCMESRI